MRLLSCSRSVSLKITGYFFYIMSTNIPTLSFSNQITCHALLVYNSLTCRVRICGESTYKGQI
jgi:hypothetical protein